MTIDKKASVYITLALTVLLLITLVAALFLVPALEDAMFARHFNADGTPMRDGQVISEMSQTLRGGVRAVLYVLDAFGIFAALCLGGVIFLILKGRVFCDTTVFLLRVISWLCIFAAIGFSLLGAAYSVSFFVAFAAVFFGIALRVVKNVIDEATQIKNENDFTV